MKVFLVACVTALAALAALAAADDLLIVDQHDFIKSFENEKEWKKILDCMLDTAPCGEMQELKDATAKRLYAQCAECTEKQLEKYHRELKALKDKYPEDFKKIMQKYSKN